MELHDFIKETLAQIVTGITEAQNSEEVINSNSAIAPCGQGIKDEDYLNQLVEFDVVVSTQKGTKTKGGIGVFVGPVSLGSSGESDQGTGFSNRIKFSVPVFLPSQKIRRQK